MPSHCSNQETHGKQAFLFPFKGKSFGISSGNCLKRRENTWSKTSNTQMKSEIMQNNSQDDIYSDSLNRLSVVVVRVM